MAIGFIMQFENMSTDKYDAIAKELGYKLHSNGGYPLGVLSHAVGKTQGGGLVVVDVWDSEKDFGAFLEGQLKPAFAKVGGISEPKVTTFEVHNRFPA
ncbi:MAG TPA: hypothetical protein VL137_07670 [Polyangiaceae bacterium]|nr:hypothetical protein [Polyangiaceae bacterium]